MVKLMLESHGDAAKSIKVVLKTALEDSSKPPSLVYSIFKDWAEAMKAEEFKAQSVRPT